MLLRNMPVIIHFTRIQVEPISSMLNFSLYFIYRIFAENKKMPKTDFLSRFAQHKRVNKRKIQGTFIRTYFKVHLDLSFKGS